MEEADESAVDGTACCVPSLASTGSVVPAQTCGAIPQVSASEQTVACSKFFTLIPQHFVCCFLIPTLCIAIRALRTNVKMHKS